MEDRDQPRDPEHEQHREDVATRVPALGRARIAGVEAGVAAGLFPSAAARDETADPGTGPVPLPDWTDPPTREVPRILLDQATDERSVPGPVWREVDADWEQDDLFADLVEEAHGRAAEREEDPWLLPPSRPAAGLVGKRDDVTTVIEQTLTAPAPSEDRVPAPFEHEAGGWRARIAWAGRAGRRRLAEPEPVSALREAAFPKPNDDAGVGGVPLPAEPPSHEGDEMEPALRAPGGVSELSEEAGGPAHRKSRGHGRSPVVATLTGAAFGAVVLVCFLVGPPAVLALVAVVLLVAMAECYQALSKARFRPATLLGLLAAPGAAVAAYLKGTDGLVLVAALFVACTFLWYLAGLTRRSPVANIAVTVMGWSWVGLLGGFAGLLISPAAFGNRTGLAYLLGALEATVAYDVGAYGIGSWLGRHRLAPAISPNKTWEGLAGGSAAAVAVALGVASQMHPWTLPRAAALGVVVAVLAPLGDLVESLVKRDLKVKDMGTLLPAHGGLLDRIDAVLFVLPATYCLARLFHG